MVRPLLGAALVTGAAILASCRAVVGVEDREPPEEPIECVDLAGLSGDCGNCAAASCCDAMEDCRADAACSSRQGCVGACAGDPACRVACDEAAPAVVTSDTLDQCLALECADACALACGGAGPPVLGCAPCGEACCAEATACAIDDDCLALRTCRRACSEVDVGCRERCRDTHAAGATLEQSVEACVTAACDITGDWSCLGRIEAPTTASSYLELNTLVYINDPPSAFEGATVEACELGTDCEHPVTSGITNADGGVRLRVPTAGGSFRGHLRVTGEGLPTTSFFSSQARVTSGIVVLGTLTDGALADLLSSNGLSLAPGRGIAFATTRDCRGGVAAGVVLQGSTSKGEIEVLYGSLLGAEPAAGATTEAGTAVFMNVPPGNFSVWGSVAARCEPMGTVDVRVGNGEVAFIDLFPTR